MSPRRLFPVLGALLLALAAACSESEAAPKETEPSPTRVELETVNREQLASSLRRTATLVSRRDFALVVESAGEVEQRPATEGALIDAGALVLSLDDAAERADVAARKTYLEDLIIAGASLSERHQAAAALERAREVLQRRHVRAPARATLDRYLVDPGEWVAPGTPVARFVDAEHLYLIATVIEADVLRIREGADAKIQVSAFPDASFGGRVVRVGKGGQSGSGRFEVEIDVDRDPRLRPGFVVTVLLPLEEEQSRMTVSREAIFTRFGTERVFIAVDQEGELRAVERSLRTRLLPGEPGRVEVIEGLEPGERVVVRGRLGLATGQRLEPAAR